MDEITRLERVIENRESTITFLNEIIDAQSESIEKLKDENAILKENLSTKDNVCYSDLAITQYKDKLIYELEKENSSLKTKLKQSLGKLEYLFNAFEKIKEIDESPKSSETNKDASEEKKRHNKELASKQWKKKREEVFERYGKQCVECGRSDNIQVHHLVYRKGRHIWEYDVDELIPLCKKCHQKVHEDTNHIFHEKYLQ